MRLLVTSAASLFALSAFAADLPRKTTAQVQAPYSWGLCKKPPAGPAGPSINTVPGGDIFGFTSGTDVGGVGDCAIAFEYTARTGKIDGSYFAGTLKNQYSATIAENFAIAFSPFVTHHSISGMLALPNKSGINFDGFSAEANYRVLSRSQSNPLAVTLSVEPRWARVDGLSGNNVSALGAEFKMFADLVLVPNKLYAGLNLNYGFAGTTFAGMPLIKGSSTNVSTALTYQVNDNFFVGAELRYLAAFDGYGMNTKLGEALFVGPTVMAKINDTTTLNAVWTPQVSGKSIATAGRLDLDNFERHQFRLKLVKGF